MYISGWSLQSEDVTDCNLPEGKIASTGECFGDEWSNDDEEVAWGLVFDRLKFFFAFPRV